MSATLAYILGALLIVGMFMAFDIFKIKKDVNYLILGFIIISMSLSLFLYGSTVKHQQMINAKLDILIDQRNK